MSWDQTASDRMEETYQKIMRDRRIKEVYEAMRRTGISKEEARIAWKQYEEEQ